MFTDLQAYKNQSMITAKNGRVLYEGVECGQRWLEIALNEALKKSNPNNWIISTRIEDTHHHHMSGRRSETQSTSEYSEWVFCGKNTRLNPKNVPTPWESWQETLQEYKDMIELSPKALTIKIFGYIPKTRSIN